MRPKDDRSGGYSYLSVTLLFDKGRCSSVQREAFSPEFLDWIPAKAASFSLGWASVVPADREVIVSMLSLCQIQVLGPVHQITSC